MAKILKFKNKRKKERQIYFFSLASAVVVGVIGGNFLYDVWHSPPGIPPEIARFAANFSPACNIKGNISYNTGERIYHVPGQKYYARTRISARRGERWFCSQSQARAAGWRRARTW